MRLILKNIRQHLNKTVEIPDTGIVKLAGRSGIGKSTILDAIRHAFLGDVDDMVNWDQDHASITLQWYGNEIVRTMRPNSLTFTTVHGKIHKDDVAQQEIYKWLGMTGEEFSATSFIQQGMLDSLLTLKPAEQLRFIQRLAFGDEDPEVTKSKVATLLTQRKSQQASAEAQMTTIKPKLEEAIFRLGALQDNRPVNPEGRSTEEIENIKIQQKELSGRIAELNKEIAELRRQRNDPIYLAAYNLPIMEAKNKEEVANLNKQIAELHSELSAVPEAFTEKNLDAITTEQKDLREGIEYLDILETAKEASDDIKERYCIVSGSPIAALKECLTQLMESSANNQMKLSVATQDHKRLSETPKAIPCPKCSAPLMIDGESIVAHSHEVDDLDEKLERSRLYIESLTEAKKRIATEKEQAASDITVLERLKIRLEGKKKPSFTSKSEALEALRRLDTQMASQTGINRQRAILTAKIDTFGKMLEKSIRAHTEWVKNVIDGIGQAESVQSIEEKIKRSEILLPQLCQSEQDLRNILEEEWKNDKIRADLRVYDEKIRSATEMVNTLTAQCAETYRACQTAENKLKGVLRLKELSDRAAMESVDAMLGALNINAKHYLDQIFEEDGTSVQLLNKKTLNDGDERAKLGLKVTHKGSSLKTTKSFSGGEKQRLTLSFQLGLGDLYKSPLLMIDEGLAWLGLEDKERCMEALRPLAESRLILLVEHILPDSMVDHTINL